MKKIIFMTILCMAGLATNAQQKSKELPPIIDREVFFGDPEISGSKLSPNGKYISFIKPFNGTRNIWVKKAGDPFESARPITADTKRPISSYFWSHDNKYILYAQDKGGNENFMIYAVNPMDKKAAGQEVPLSRNLTDKENVRVQIYAVPKSNPDLMYIGLNDRDPAWHDLYELKISTGELKLMRENKDRMVAWIFDLKDKLKLAMRSNEDGSTELLKVEPKGFTKIYSTNLLESFNPVYFHTDGAQIYMETNKGDDVNFSKLILFNINNKKETLVESDPEKKVDFGSVSFSENTHQMIATSYEDDKTRIYWKDKNYESDYKLLKKQFKGMEVSFNNSTKDEMTWLISVYSDTDPGSVYLFDRNTKKTLLQYKSRPKMPIQDLSPMRAISYKSSDGLVIPAYLTLPKGIPAKNLPLIVNPHGGPWARDGWGYDSYAQFLANRGYAVLQSNFRSSTGFGKKFLNAGNKQWGDLMQDDLTYGVKHLINKGIVDPKRVGIMGGSYGGYATLAGLTFTPDVYACGVSIVGPSSLLTLLQSIPPYWEAGRKIFHERMGDPTNPAGEAQLKKQSPLYAVDQIKVPLMVVQGANDPRVKKAESDQIVLAMKDKNLAVEYICAPDEGHGFQRPVNNMAFLAAAEKFLAKHLGGRYQESMPDEIAKRLKEITVDINGIAKEEKIDMSTMSVATPSKDLKAGIYEFNVKLDAMGHKMDFAQKIEVKDQGEYWTVTDVMDMPMGALKDVGNIKKGSLELLKRSVDQGPVNMLVNYSATEADCKINMSGQKSEHKIKLNHANLADGPGAFLVISSLPLNDTYKALLYHTDLQKMEEKIMSVIVTGSEKVKNKDCYKVEIKSVNGDPGMSTLWVSKDETARVVKYEIVIAEMQGATMVGEAK
ncbi:MAG: S9 family peptidase [Saprospiraceae bacterium]